MRGAVPTLLAAFLTAFSLFALTGYQVTSETAATRLLGRLGAALVEVDRWLPAHREDLELVARDRRQSRVRPADIPIDVTLPAVDILDASEETLRDRLVRAMGQVLYRDGAGGFRDAQGKEGNLGVDEPVRWTAGLLSAGAHRFWEAALPLSLLLLLAATAGVLMNGRPPLPALLVGALLAALGSVAGWFLAEAGSGVLAAPADKEILLIVRDAAWIGLRDSLAVSAVLATLLLLNSMLGLRREEPWSPDPPQPHLGDPGGPYDTGPGAPSA